MISFGPVPSRRLGKSLGINNILSPKTCSYGCIYCQVGKTLKYRTRRQEFFQPERILHEVEQHIDQLDKKNYPDYLSFVSNGEPTLDVYLGRTISLLKKFKIPIAVITNASLLKYKSVRVDLSLADWVSVKMDAPDIGTWKSINNPASNLNFKTHLESVMNFADEYNGILCTETMLVSGINDRKEKLLHLASLIKKLRPYKAYISIPIRPPTLSSVKAPDMEKINEAWQIFSDQQIQTELLTGFEGTNAGYTGNAYDDILNITSVHPLREDSLMQLLHNDHADFSVVESLISQQLIRIIPYLGKNYFLRKYNLNK